MKLRMKILDLGQMKFEKYRLVETKDHHEMIISPMLAVLIQHPTLGNILFDTGNDDAWKETYSKEIKETYPITVYRSIVDCLDDVGLTPQDINIIIISHLHFDHTGGLKFFANTKSIKKVIVSDDDMKEAFELTGLTPNGTYGAYVRKTFTDIPGISFNPINETVNLAPEITLFVQRAHTAGCIGLKIDLENNGSIIISSDAVYTSESFEKGIPPEGSLNRDSKEFLNNRHRLLYMKSKFNASVFFGHDYEQATEWQNRGWID